MRFCWSNKCCAGTAVTGKKRREEGRTRGKCHNVSTQIVKINKNKQQTSRCERYGRRCFVIVNWLVNFYFTKAWRVRFMVFLMCFLIERGSFSSRNHFVFCLLSPILKSHDWFVFGRRQPEWWAFYANIRHETTRRRRRFSEGNGRETSHTRCVVSSSSRRFVFVSLLFFFFFFSVLTPLLL